jgi:hypothetical protein
MKKLTTAVLFLSILAAQADIVKKIVAVQCGNADDIKAIIGFYDEQPIVVAKHQNDGVVIILWANRKTQTSTWVVHLPSTGEYCTLASGTELLIIEQTKKDVINYR